METDLYSFVYKGILTEEALDKAGRRRKSHLGAEEAISLMKSLSFDLLDSERLATARRMSLVYSALHAFENEVRAFVTKAMVESYKDSWWDKVPERIQKMAKSRMDEDSKYKWHGARGAAPINYCDFGDLSSIIVTNWTVFENVVGNLEWAKSLLGSLEKSRNTIMHGGALAKEDVERIGMNIRDWIRQTG